MGATWTTGQRLLAWSIAVAAAVYAVYMASAVPQVAAWITNSDQLTLPALVVDITARPANFFGWQLPRSSYLFPDTLAYALVYWTTHRPIDSILLADVPVLLAWVYVVHRSAPHSATDSRVASLAFAIATALLVPLLLTQLSDEMAAWVTKYAFSFANHFTAFVIGVLLLGFMLDELASQSSVRLASIGILTALVAASNRAVWLFFVLPGALILAAQLLRSPRAASHSVSRIAVTIAAAVALGFALEGSVNRIAVMPYELTVSSMSGRARTFFQTVWTYALAHPGMAVGLAALVAFYGLVGWRLAAAAPAFWRRRMHAPDERDWLFDTAILATAAANVLATMVSWQNIGNARYLMLFFFAPPLLVRRLVPTLRLRPMVAAALLLFAGSAVAGYRGGGPFAPDAYARSETVPLTGCLRSLHLGRGLANYWTARRMAFLSQGDIRVDQVSPGAGSKETLFFYWGNNAYDFLRGHPDVDPYQYVIANDLDPTVLRSAFGPPDSVTHCANREIWTYTDGVRLFAGLFQGHLEPWERALVKDWAVSIPAAAFRGTEGVTQGLERVSRSASTGGGALIDARLALPAGAYRFSLAYSTPDAQADAVKVGTLTLARGGGQAPSLVDLLSTQAGRPAQARVDADIAGPDDVVEPQVLVNGTASVRVSTLTITAQSRRAETEIRLRAGDPHLHTQVGVERDGFVASTGAGGVLLYGPYLPLPAGRYRASLFVDTDRPSAMKGRVDVAVEQGRRVLAMRPIEPAAGSSAPGSRSRIDLDFELARAVSDLELRVFVEDNASVKVAGYEILPRADATAGRTEPNAERQP